MLATLDTIAPPPARPGIRVSGNPVQPEEAIDVFGKKAPLDKAAWLALSLEARKRAFTAAWVTDVNVLQSVKDSLDKAIAEGQSFEAWKKGIRKELGEKWSRSDGYLDTVFRNNVQSAYAAGRYKAQTTPAILRFRPFWRLVVLMDDRTSPYCKPLAKPPVVLPATDPWWLTNFPPRHHKCRSTTATASRREAERLGISKKAPTLNAQEGWGSTAGLGEWQPTGEALDPRLFKPAEKAAEKELPKVEPTVSVPARVPEVATRPPAAVDPAPRPEPAKAPTAKPATPKTARMPPALPVIETAPVLRAADLAKRGIEVDGDIDEASERVFGGKAPTIEAIEATWSAGGVAAKVDTINVSKSGVAIGAALTKDGVEVGRIYRNFVREDGVLRVEHVLVKLDDSEQGKGIGESLLRQSIKAYQQIGAREIRLEANWIGRYTWARMGFNWDATNARRVRSRLEKYLAANGVPAEEAKAIAAATHKNAALVAGIEVNGKRLGKAFLLSKDNPLWNGRLRLDRPNDPGYIRAKERLKL